ncbi:endoglucanase A, partial [Raphidocelis subcapitata]
DSYSPAVALLLAQQTGDADAWGHYRGFLDAWTSGRSNGDVVVSPQGFSWYTKDQGWGSLRHMGGAAFLALVGAKGDSGEARDKAVCWAHGQIAYALGDAGRSYVVGFGSNPPQRPHHRGASCPDAPAPCNYNAVWAPGANPRTITGALVGGPNDKDEYTDDRGDARSNEVAIDYNAGFTGALAGLKQAPIDYAACKAKGLGRQKRG